MNFFKPYLLATEIKFSNTGGEANLGCSVSISGNYAIAGVSASKGVVYLYEFHDNRWLYRGGFSPTDSLKIGDFFGGAVSIYGNFALVSSIGDDDNGDGSGSCYIFARNGDKWEQQAKIYANDGKKNDSFGDAVSIHNNRAIIGAICSDNGRASGAAYIFEYQNSKWIQKEKLLAYDATERDMFGRSVSIYNNNAIVGAYMDDDNGLNSGSAYIYEFEGSRWLLKSKITPKDAEANDWFGHSVSISENYAIVGSVYDDNRSGSAYIFVRNDNSWKEQAKITANDKMNSDQFGYSVSISGDYAIIGAINSHWNVNRTGSAYIFKRENNTWIQQIKLIASDGATDDNYGNAVAISEDYVIVGSRYKDLSDTKDIGAVYLYPINTKPPIISGYVKDSLGLPFVGATINFNDWKSVETDENGFYSIELPHYNWSGNANISFNNYRFNPSSHSFYPVSEDKPDQNYTIQLYTISGFVKDINDNPISGIQVNFSNKGGVEYTNSSGYYSHDVYHNWSGEVRVSGKGYKFEPFYQNYSNVSQNYSDQSYKGNKLSISGYCLDQSNVPISGVEMILFDPIEKKCLTDEYGFYNFDVGYEWSGKLATNKPGYTFEPDSYEYTIIMNSFGNQNFIGQLTNVKITGIVSDDKGAPINNVLIQISEVDNSITTNLSGQYEFFVNYLWSGNITPLFENYTFEPPLRTYVTITEEQSNQNFIGTNQNQLLNVTPTKLNLSSKQGSEIIHIEIGKMQENWSATVHPSSSWINISSSINSINVSYSKNIQNYGRYALILIKSGEITKSVEVIQAFENSSSGINPPDWKVEPSDFRYQGNINAIVKDINNNILQSDNDLLGAFVDNQCRGVVSPSPSADGKRFFLQVWSNQTNEILSFKYYNSVNNNIYKDVLPDVEFIPDLILGNILNPFELKVQPSQPIPDANNDGRVDVIDAIDVLKFIVK